MTDDEKLCEIFHTIGRDAVIEQALEECGEFIQAGAKHLRILHGKNYTPVKLADNCENLLEEMADVMLCIDVLITAFSADRDKTKKNIEAIKCAKLERWLTRLNIGGEK